MENPKLKLTRRGSSNSWSELPPDLLNSVFERLNFADFRRAESVCSSWYSASKQCVTKKHSPWLILFPEDDDDDENCRLFSPEEEGGKVYKRHVEFAKTSVCLATYGSWLFMLEDYQYNLYIMNIFTNERINLPPVESQLGTTKVDRILDGCFRIWENDQQRPRKCRGISFKSPMFWIDEQTKDYLVLWGFGFRCVVYSKKGDDFWSQIPLVSTCSDMVYKDYKLYLLKKDDWGNSNIQILDFSGEIPEEIFQFSVIANGFHQFEYQTVYLVATKLVVTVKGDVLKVEKMKTGATKIWSFRIYKVCSSSGLFRNYEKVDSLGNEAMLFDLGITVLANDMEGLKRNSIYSNIICPQNNTTQICLFDLETQKMESLHKFDCSSAQQRAKARWFLPSFM